MDQPPLTSRETLTVLYDGGCPLCRREIAHVQGLAHEGSALCFVDISSTSTANPATDRFAADRSALMARFHVQLEDGSRLSGAAAFVAMWARLPGWRWAARLAQLPGALPVLEAAYRGFLLVRPAMQAMARRWDTKGIAAAAATPARPDSDACEKATETALPVHLLRELRSDRLPHGCCALGAPWSAPAQPRRWCSPAEFEKE